MIPFETRLKIDEVSEDVVDFNNYRYKVCKGTIGPCTGLYVYIPEKHDVIPGTCLETSAAFMTGFISDDGKKNIAVRIDKLRIVDADGFEPLKSFVARINGLIIKSDSTKLTFSGPMSIPFIQCTLAYKNENQRVIKVPIIARGNSARLVDGIDRSRYIDCTVTVRPRKKKAGSFRVSIDDYNYVERKR